MFNDPLELLAFYDADIREQRFVIYPWQVKVLRDFAADEKLTRLALVAANGSGKSRFVLAPCAIWHAAVFNNSQTVITSGSAAQLNKQTERYVRQLAEKMNYEHRNQLGGGDVWEIKQHQLKNLKTGSYIDLFATDEPDKAEGWHPIVPGGRFAILVDEAKGVDEGIYDALDRCNGCTKRMDISSPGQTNGHFFDVVTRADDLGWKVYQITAWDCPHITQEEINSLIIKHGIHDPLVRSSLFAEFTAVDDAVVVLPDVYKDCKRYFVGRKHFGPRRAGLDLSGGGDEYVLSIWEGNTQVGQETFRFKDTNEGVKEIISLFHKWKLKPSNVYADDGGIGQGILDNLAGRGYEVNRIRNQTRPADQTRYQNRGTELWFSFKRYIEESQIKLIDDKLLASQICNRYYKRQQASSKIMLEPKQEAKKKGHPSPDRADAAVLAWVPYPFEENLPDEKEREEQPYPKRGITKQEAFDNVRRELDQYFFPTPTPTANDGCFRQSNLIKNYGRTKKYIQKSPYFLQEKFGRRHRSRRKQRSE